MPIYLILFAISSSLPAIISVQNSEVAVLIKRLADPDEVVRLKSAKELGKLKERAKDAIPALTESLKDKDQDVRTVARNALAEIRFGLAASEEQRMKDKVLPLMKLLQSKDLKLRLSAIAELQEMGQDAQPAGAALAEFGIMNTNAKVREAAIAAFEKIEPKVYKPAITLFLDSDSVKRLEALQALQRMGPDAKSTLPLIKDLHNQLFRIEKRPSGRTLSALVAIAPDDPGVQSLVLSLVAASDDGLPLYQNNSGTLVGRQVVISFMNNTKADPKQRYTALATGLVATRSDRPLIIAELGKLGADAKAAIPALKKLKTDKEAVVRDAAAAAIEAIESAK